MLFAYLRVEAESPLAVDTPLRPISPIMVLILFFGPAEKVGPWTSEFKNRAKRDDAESASSTSLT